VVAGDHDVEFAACRASEDRVTRERPLDRDAARLRMLNRRLHYPRFFLTEQALLAGMWIEASQRDMRMREAEARQLACREIDDAAEQLARQQTWHFGKRHVHGRKHHLQRLRPEHHRHTR